MATTLRAQRLIDAKRAIEKAITLSGKISALRELLTVPRLGRDYQRFAHKELITYRAEAAESGNDELLRRLDLLDERLASHAEYERSRRARKRGKQPKVTVSGVPLAQSARKSDLVKIWSGEK